MKRFGSMLALVLAAVLGMSPAAARDTSLDAPLLLAAAPALEGPYARAVLLVVPTGDGMHIGFVLNRPTGMRVADVFPEVPAAKDVRSPVFAGGPQLVATIVALTYAPHAPTENAEEILPDLFMAFGNQEAAHAAARFPGRSRFYAGLAAWRSGELQAELRAGAWQTHAPELELVIGGSADTLWERILERTRTMLALR
jgi:putative transcriptional regulator